jgi:hypothetical protein
MTFLLPQFLMAMSRDDLSKFLKSVKSTDIIEVRTLGKVTLEKVILEIRLPEKSLQSLQNSLPSLIELQNETFMFEKDRLIWGYGLTQRELKVLLKEATACHQMNRNPRTALLWLNSAYASDIRLCDLKNDPKDVSELSTRVNSMAISDFVKKCDYNFENLISKKIDELKETWKKLEGASLEGFLTALKDGFKALKEILPQINAKIIQPLIDLAEKVPPLANKLVCDFVENKVGDVFLTLASGPAGLARLTAKTGQDIAEFASKIYKFTHNGTASLFVVELHRQGKLKPELLSRLTQMQNDIPAELKQQISKRFHGFHTHEKMRDHIDKHKKEMGFRSDEDYLNAAHHFAKHIDKDNIVFVESSGLFKKWNTKSDEFLVLDSRGRILTYYKQSCNDRAEKLLVLVLSLDEKNQQGVCKQN